MDRDLILMGRRTLLKEIEALRYFVDQIDESFAQACELLFDCKGTVLLTGMGKSGLVARKWASTFASTGTRAYFVNPAEAPHGDLGIMHPNDVLVALSNSGETEELGFVVRHALDCKVPLIGVTGKKSSSLARQSQIVLSVELSEEACPLGLAPTTSTTIMMALGDAIAINLMQMRGFTDKDFARLHPGGSLGRRLWLRVDELMHKGSDIPRVGPKDSFRTVLVEMTQKRLGLAVVVESEKVLGLITDGDLRRFFQREPNLEASCASQMMTANPKSVVKSALAVEAKDQMKKNKIQHLLVTEDSGALCGVIHFQDLLKAHVV